MIWFLVGVVLLILVLLASKAFISADPRTLRRILRLTGIAVLGTTALVLALTGRLSLAVPLAAVAFMLLGRRFRLGGLGVPGGVGAGGAGPGRRQGPKPRPGQASQVETEFLRMQLDHDSGAMEGEVLRGPFAGRALSELSLHELISFYREVLSSDQQSARLLEAFLDREHGDRWREEEREAGEQGERPGARGDALTPDEAYAILGLEPGATSEQIKDAHRRLMLKLHPDQGGSTYLAAKINAAKELLLRLQRSS